MLDQLDRLGRSLSFETADRCPVRIFWVYHPRHGFGGERIRIETPPFIIDSSPTLISNGKTEVIYEDE